MNIDEARQLESGGWHWTTMNDGKARTAWPCIEYVGDAAPGELVQGKAKPEDFKRCDPHATKEEAERHFYDACLAEVEEIEFSDWRGCCVCDQPTKKFLGNRPLGHFFYHPAPLCDEHRTREQLALLWPFRPGIAFAHS